MAQFFFRALPVITARDATMDFEQLTFALNNGDVEVNAKGELKLTTGAWTKAESFSAKLESTTTIEVRKEQAGGRVFLKGIAKAKEALPAKTSLFTLPVGFRPKEDVFPLAGELGVGALTLRIKTTGVVENESEIPIARFPTFDGANFNLT